VGNLGEEFDRSCRRSRSRYPGAEWMPVMDVIENGEEYVVGSRRPGSTRRTWTSTSSVRS
jgi:hypothetical protein